MRTPFEALLTRLRGLLRGGQRKTVPRRLRCATAEVFSGTRRSLTGPIRRILLSVVL